MAITKAQLSAMKEAQLQTQVLIPLFQSMGFQHVHLRQGSTELGKDIVMWKPGELGERVNYAVVAKAKPVSGKASGPSSAANVRFQIEQAFGNPWLDPMTTEEQWVERCWVVCSKAIKNEAITAIKGVLSNSNLDKVTRFINGDELWELIQKHLPEHAVFENLQQLQSVLDGIDPHYRVIATTEGVLLLEPKHPGAVEEHPLIITTQFAFKDTEAGHQARAEMERWITKGTAVEIAAEHIEGFSLPSPLKALIPESTEGVKLVLGAQVLPAPFVARISIECEDGGAAMEYIECQGIRGTEEITLSNEDQPVPWKFSITLNHKEKRFQMNYKMSYPLNVREALEAFRFADAMSKGGHVRIEHLATGMLLVDQDIAGGSAPPVRSVWLEALEKLVLIQRKTETLIAVHESQIVDRGVLSLIFSVAEIIETGHASIKAGALDTSGGVELARNLLTHLGSSEPKSIALTVEAQPVSIFGVDVDLGPVAYVCEQVYLAKEDAEALDEALKSASPESTFPIHLSVAEGASFQAWYQRWLPPH
jgi:hypothetical protein